MFDFLCDWECFTRYIYRVRMVQTLLFTVRVSSLEKFTLANFGSSLRCGLSQPPFLDKKHTGNVIDMCNITKCEMQYTVFFLSGCFKALFWLLFFSTVQVYYAKDSRSVL